MSSNPDFADAADCIDGRPAASLVSRALRRRLSDAAIGSLRLVLPSGEQIAHRGQTGGPHAELRIVRWRALARLVLDGDIGFAEAYIAGEWSTPDLPVFLEWAARNSASLDDAFRGLPLLKLVHRAAHIWRSNSRRGSRRNISAHYDLGNSFYALWLDRGMNYSSAIYTDDTPTLEAAQRLKLARAAALLEARPGARVLELGCGWGALAEHLVAEHDCTVDGLTLSSEQRAFAVSRLEQAGCGDRARIRLEDYRDARGTYDRVVSIEMLEAVGEAYWPGYFAALRDRLRRGGVAVLQSISISEERFASYRRSADFIQSQIFPGGMLPTSSLIRQHLQAAGLKLSAVETFGASYALTLAEWRRRFLASWPDVERLGFDARFKRTWEYYLAYCEAGFRAGSLDVGLYKIERVS